MSSASGQLEVSAGTLTGSAGTTVALGGANTINTLGAFASNGGFSSVSTLLTASPVADSSTSTPAAS